MARIDNNSLIFKPGPRAIVIEDDQITSYIVSRTAVGHRDQGGDT
jgi:hypothetical protein